MSFRRQRAIEQLEQGQEWEGRYNQGWCAREVLRTFLRSVRKHICLEIIKGREGHRSTAKMWEKPGVAEWSKETGWVKFGKPFSWDVLEKEGIASRGWWNEKSGDGERMARATTGRRGRMARAGQARQEGIT